MMCTHKDIDQAIQDLSMCRFFPADEGTQAAIQRLLVKICPSRDALEWLVSEFVNVIGEWKGPAELRAVLCTRYRPVDGIEADSQIPGYRPVDGEERSLQSHQALKAIEGGSHCRIEAPAGGLTAAAEIVRQIGSGDLEQSPIAPPPFPRR